jgi:hypothetical protein
MSTGEGPSWLAGCHLPHLPSKGRRGLAGESSSSGVSSWTKPITGPILVTQLPSKDLIFNTITLGSGLHHEWGYVVIEG